jgi:regulator of sirC expression with transglutaminase-like and TPR domain
MIWGSDPGRKLLEGFFLISQYIYPEIKLEELSKEIDLVIEDVEHEINENLTSLEKVRVLNHVIFDIHRFKSNRRSSQTVQSHFLNNLLDTKRGNNLSLGILYLIVSRRLHLPVFGVDLPKHFLLAYTSEDLPAKEKCMDSDKVLFYINPFTGGSVITREEVKLFIQQMKIPNDPSLYCPCNEVKIIKRLLLELINHYTEHNFKDKVAELGLMMDCLGMDETGS